MVIIKINLDKQHKSYIYAFTVSDFLKRAPVIVYSSISNLLFVFVLGPEDISDSLSISLYISIYRDISL